MNPFVVDRLAEEHYQELVALAQTAGPSRRRRRRRARTSGPSRLAQLRDLVLVNLLHRSGASGWR